MIIDLHSHTNCSDGELSPSDLLKLASEHGVNVLALTDHDTTLGLDEARQQATELGIRFINGVEISALWGTVDIHIVALQIDPTNETLQAGLKATRLAREVRAKSMGERLAAQGIKGVYEGAKAIAGDEIIARPHFAKHLVATGVVKDIPTAFKRYLVRGKAGYVPTPWPSYTEAVSWIRQAGGIAVVAHPARYRLTMSKLRSLLQDFKEAGGQAMEVATANHTAEEMELMSRACKELNLLASAGSDFHGPTMSRATLGKVPALPPGLTPVWQDWGLEAV